MENNAEVVEKTATDKDDELMVVAEVKNNKSTTESSSLNKNSSPKTPKTPKATNIKNKEKENPSEENLQSKVEVVASTNTPLIIDSIIKTPEPNQASKRKTSDVSTPQSEASPSGISELDKNAVQFHEIFGNNYLYLFIFCQKKFKS